MTRAGRALSVLILLLLAPSFAPAQRAGNHLTGAASPYLRMHAQDPVDWYPWTPETLAKARREQKPIFLSIGYSTCHWCHVMQAESFRDVGIAELLNQNFLDPLENLFTRRCHDTSLFGIDVGLLQRGDHTPVSRTFSVDPVRPGRSGRPSARNSTTRFSTPRLARAIADRKAHV